MILHKPLNNTDAVTFVYFTHKDNDLKSYSFDQSVPSVEF